MESGWSLESVRLMYLILFYDKTLFLFINPCPVQ